jgi:hypothetical protein
MTTQWQESPLFLVGAECSGTVLLRLMLHNHPQVTWCDEFEYAVERINDRGQFPDLPSYYDWLATHRIFQSRGFIIDTNLDYRALVQSFLAQQAERHQKPIVGAIVHHHFDRVLHIWPNARFIHIVRDPRDVVWDYKQLGWVGNVWTGVTRWLIAERLWSQLTPRLTPERWLELSYEDLMRDHPATLERLCAFVGVPYDAAMLSYPDYTDYELPQPDQIALWCSHLMEVEVQLIEARVGELLRDRGYEPSGYPHIRLNGRDRLWLKIQDRLSRARFRLQRYGPRLFWTELITRKLRLNQLHRPIKYQLNEIDRAFLKKSWR